MTLFYKYTYIFIYIIQSLFQYAISSERIHLLVLLYLDLFSVNQFQGLNRFYCFYYFNLFEVRSVVNNHYFYNYMLFFNFYYYGFF